jgi:hypothetical protein
MVKEIFIECFEKKMKSNQILNEKDITSLRNGLFSGVFGKWGNYKLSMDKNQKDILFGLKSGIVFYEKEVLFIVNKKIIEDKNYNSKTYPFLEGILLTDKNLKVKYGYDWYTIALSDFDFEFFKLFYSCYNIRYKQKETNKLIINNKKEENKKIRLEKIKNQILIDLDKDKNGELDLIQNDFNKIIIKNQKKILDIDSKFIHQFVKISNFINTKKQNTQRIFESIRDTSSKEELEERVSLLKNQIHSYELLVFHSNNMIGSLISEDLITFYEIYESFDKLGMFNSNWESEVSEKLTNIGNQLDDLMYSIYDMEYNIVNALSNLNYVTQESFENLNRSVTNQLREVESSINTNNLLTGIQTYQLYKINKNTKSLRR